MTLQEFVSLWQARPFRAFRLHAGDQVLTVEYPLAAALMAEQGAVAVVEGDQVRVVPLAGITGADVHGPAREPAEAIAAMGPARLAHDASLLAKTQRAAEGPPPPPPARDPGRVVYTPTRAPDGRHAVHATVLDRAGEALFRTAGTGWNAHGHEPFENGTALYLHHAARPTVEQRVLLWPPDHASFDSFAEATTPQGLQRELERRDRRLSRRPAPPPGPKAAWYRSIVPAYPEIPDDGRAQAFGREQDDFERYETRLTRAVTGSGRKVVQPSLIDVAGESILFHLIGTAWTGGVERREETFVFQLEDTGRSGAVVAFTVEPRRLTARLHDAPHAWPLGFFQRALHNFALHEQGNLLHAELRGGPAAPRRPDHVWPVAGDFRIELWGGDVRHPLPFLQPLIVDPAGQPRFDLRATSWGGIVAPHPERPRVNVRLVSHEMQDRLADARLTLEIDLVAQVVTCAGYEGSTSLGMLQALVRHVRGTRWLQEELPRWLAKGREVPLPADFHRKA